MISENRLEDGVLDDLAREYVYRYLAGVLRGPETEAWTWTRSAEARALVLGGLDWLRGAEDVDESAASADDVSASSIARLVQERQAPEDQLAAEFDRVFGLLVPKDCPPYETEYLPTNETFTRSQEMADVAGFYRAFGLEPSRRDPDRPDHLGLEFEFMAFVLMKKRLAAEAPALDQNAAERIEVCDRAQRSFFQDHLAWWVPSFATRLGRKTRGAGLYVALAEALTAWIPAECRRLGVTSVLRPVFPETIEAPETPTGCASCGL